MTRTVVIIEDHPIVRQGIRSIIEEVPGIVVSGEADNGIDGLKVVEVEEPDLVLVDLSLPEISGLVVIPLIRDRSPRSRILVFSNYADGELASAALEAGAAGYVVKNSDVSFLVTAIREILAGRNYLSPSIVKNIHATVSPHGGSASGPTDVLSNREREVFSLVISGKSSRQIGKVLHISHRTVERHRQNMMGKLGVKSVRELMVLAAQSGVLAPRRSDLS